MKPRWVFIYGALLLLLANGTYGDGRYQRTKEGRAFVWDNYPKPDETATWSGDRDADGYATGPGTLTWYTVERKMMTGSNVPDVRYTVIGSFTGKMVHGKLEGPVVDLDPNGKKFHAKFVDGRRASDWVAGPEKKKQVAANDQERDQGARRAELVEPPAPAEEPVAEEKADQPVSEPTGETPRAVNENQKGPERPVKETRSRSTDDSLESLISAPSFLRMSARGAAQPQASAPPAVSSQPAGPRLTQAEVIGMADAGVRAQGYNLDEYRRTLPQYTGETWSVSYDSKSVDANGMGGVGKHFVVSVEDKTKKTSVVAGK